MLKTLTNKFSPDVIFTVTLPGQAISSIDALSDCANLMVLNLSKNNIESLLPLRNLTKLRILNMSGNCVSNVNALEGANQLVNLHLEGNMLKGIDQMRALADCSALRNLSLQTLSGNDPNPICDLADYRRNLLSHLPQLKRLDGTIFLTQPYLPWSKTSPTAVKSPLRKQKISKLTWKRSVLSTALASQLSLPTPLLLSKKSRASKNRLEGANLRCKN